MPPFGALMRLHYITVYLFPGLFQTLSFNLVYAQQSASAAKCIAGWEWASNKRGNSPCDVAAQLLSLCEKAGFSLPGGGFYTPSTSSSASIRANICSCNVVSYNLLSACQTCQNSGASVLSWSNYAESCSTCSSETGISPGPCGPQQSIGFPERVAPQSMAIAIPAWAYYNSSAGSWSPDSARRVSGSDHTTLLPEPTSTSSPTSPATSSGANSTASSTARISKQTEESNDGMSGSMRGAVIACSLGAALIAVIFLTYLLRLCIRKRQIRQRKEFSDAVFDEVKVQNSPKMLRFRQALGRITLPPRTPRHFPATPKTARLRHFPNPFSPKKRKETESRSSREILHADAVGGETDEKGERGQRQRQNSTSSSIYSNSGPFEDRKFVEASSDMPLPSSEEAETLPDTIKVGDFEAVRAVSQSLCEVKALEQPRRAKHKIQVSTNTLSSIPKDTSTQVHTQRPPRAVRVKSQTASISRWSESSARDSTKDDGTTWSRIPSMSNESMSESGMMSGPVAPSHRYLENRRETLRSPGPDRDGCSADYRQSHSSDGSERSMLRRLDSVVKQMDFGDMASPMPWRKRQTGRSIKSTKSAKSPPPPSPSGTNVGYAL